MADRLDDVRRSFDRALVLGARRGEMTDALAAGGFPGYAVESDLSPAMARGRTGAVFVADEELLPVADGAFDLVLSTLVLHWVNDLPGALVQMRRALRPDGLMLATLFGGETLCELQQALIEAELEIVGGVHPRVAPMTDIRDAGRLLQRAGFVASIVDMDHITVDYKDPLHLLRDVRMMGDSSALAGPRTGLRRDVLALALERYRTTAGRDRLPATFDILTLSGWAPAGP
ncbi:MAG: methyltransferase domain-containing protein [Alphaproteobacteria bacterium]